MHHPDRLTHPLIKRNGNFERATWDEALDLVASKFKEIQDKVRKGRDRRLFRLVADHRKNVSAGQICTCGFGYEVCRLQRPAVHGQSAAAGNNKAFGIDRAANPWADIPLAEVLMIAGSNCAETFPVLNKFLWQQRDNGGLWIIIDPRETATARQGDLHLQLKPGTDVAVANGMLNVIIREGLDRRRFYRGPHERLGRGTGGG